MLPAFEYQIDQHNERIRRIEAEARRRELETAEPADPAQGRDATGGWLGLRRAFGHAFARSMPGRPG
jgi:hypothetical protein